MFRVNLSKITMILGLTLGLQASANEAAFQPPITLGNSIRTDAPILNSAPLTINDDDSSPQGHLDAQTLSHLLQLQLGENAGAAPEIQLCLTGGSCGGGGSVIRCEGQSRFFLLDLLLQKPELATTRQNAGVAEISKLPARPDISWLDWKTAVADVRSVPFRQALNLLQRWQQASCQNQPVTAALAASLERQLKQMPYLLTSHLFNEIKRYELPRQPVRCEIRTAMLYLYHYGPIISLPVWDQLDLRTQVGLLIHEGLRQLQANDQALSDGAIERITAKLLLSSPDDRTDFAPLLGPSGLAHTLNYMAQTSPRCERLEECDPERSEMEIVTHSRVGNVFEIAEEVRCLQAHHQRENIRVLQAHPEQSRRLLKELIQKKFLQK